MAKRTNKPATAAPAATFTKPEPVAPATKKGTSTVENPVGVTWVTCINATAANDGLLARGAYHKAAMAAGVAYYTARTQVDRYLRWERAGRPLEGLPRGVTLGVEGWPGEGWGAPVRAPH